MIITTKFSVFLQTLLFLIVCGGASSYYAGSGGDCRESERMALLEFKAELLDEYGRLSSWGSITNCCEWKGVVCDNRSNHIVALHLHGPRDDDFYPDPPVPGAPLRGKISPSLLQLPHLHYLDLSLNDFHGTTIPSFIGSLTELHHLNLNHSNFGGPIPHHIGNLSMLQLLDLHGNTLLMDTNLDWLSRSQSLEFLDLSHANLNRCTTWLQQIHKLSALKEIHLTACGLPAVAPLSLNSSSTSLSILDLSANSFVDSSTVLLSWFPNMSRSFTYIDFSGNSFLDGRIPDALGNLMSLAHLDITYSNLNSSIPHFLGNLTSLSCLDLSYNQLHGEFPRPPKNTSSLTYLDLSSNRLNGQLPRILTWLHDSTRLKYLSLGDNLLTGSFPNMSRFTLLKELYLENNGLNGAVLEGNVRLPYLEYLDLSMNKFVGRLPDLSTCQQLRVLALFQNAFNGSSTESIQHLSKIESLRVGYNQLEGEFHLSKLPQLRVLDLSFNLNLSMTTAPSLIHPVQFRELHLAHCKLGPHFPKWLQNQNQVGCFDISNSGIFDTIPAWFWDNIYPCNYVNMSHNHMYGVLPDLSSKFRELTTLDLSCNEFNGSLPHLPPVVYNIDLSRNRFSGTIHNFCSFKDMHLLLDLSNNLLSGEIPQDCFMNLLSLGYINLASNNFSGEIPTTDNSACLVSSLHLRNNSFRGEISRSLMRCSEMRILDLGGNKFSGKIPRWLGESMPNLGVLILKSNMFYGSLPPSICHLANLQVLDISLNRITGTIPKCIDNFTLLSSDIYSDSWNKLFSSWRNDSYDDESLHDSASVIWKGNEETYFNTLGLLKMIDLSSNELSGVIPSEVTNLTGIVGLNISRNNLVGFIPDNIDQLKLLNFLDLSRNNLSGSIPPTLSKLSHLGVLNVSFNNLWGRIPWDTHMQTFGASTYLGNPGLCGPPLLSRPCPEDEKPSNGTTKEDDNEEDTFITKGFYISMLLGLIVAFWVTFWTLFFNKWWNVRICLTVADWLYVHILVNKRRCLRVFGNAS